MKAHFFDPKDSISVIKYLATFKLAWDNNSIHEGAVIWVLLRYVSETLAKALNSCMCATNRYFSFAALVRNVENWAPKLLRSYIEVVNYLLKKFATSRAITQFDSASLRSKQPATMTTQQYAEDLVAK